MSFSVAEVFQSCKKRQKVRGLPTSSLRLVTPRPRRVTPRPSRRRRSTKVYLSSNPGLRHARSAVTALALRFPRREILPLKGCQSLRKRRSRPGTPTRSTTASMTTTEGYVGWGSALWFAWNRNLWGQSEPHNTSPDHPRSSPKIHPRTNPTAENS